MKQYYKNLALYVQTQLNKWSVAKIEHLIKKIGINNICISGGVGLNGVTNTFIEQKTSQNVFVPPFPSDQGQALGNAIWGYINICNLNNKPQNPKIKFLNFTYLGTEYTNDEILDVCEDYRVNQISFTKEKDIFNIAAELLKEGKVIGWFQGRSEYGARALGNRSILASPCSAKIRDRVNILKGREQFRPLAPSVLAEHCDKFFHFSDSSLYPFMLGVVQAKEKYKEQIEGVVHIDNSSRIQILNADSNKRFHLLITEFYKKTNIPMVINTSFNMAGYPIVEDPKDAIKSAISMNLDALVCNDILITFNN